jgi:hypothetical protein
MQEMTALQVPCNRMRHQVAVTVMQQQHATPWAWTQQLKVLLLS